MKKDISPEVRKYFQEIGRIQGNRLKEKYGSEYFKKISAMRKVHGRQMPKKSVTKLKTL